MYITCSAIWNAGITKDKVGCCESCHVDDEDFDMGLLDIYADEIGVEGRDKVGDICCTVSHALDELPNRAEVLKGIWETKR